MGIYFEKRRGWRYEFVILGKRYASKYFKTKKEAKENEAKKREEIKNPTVERTTPIDMAFSELLNRRLDHVLAYNSAMHYDHNRYLFRRLMARWGDTNCSDLSTQAIEEYLIERQRISPGSANKDLRLLKALFNFGKKKGLIEHNPADGIDFFPVEENRKYVPPKQDILKVIFAADSETRDYLWTIALTMGRKGEIDQLRWSDVNFEKRYVTLYTRKKKGGNRRGRNVPMVEKLYDILSRRYACSDKSKPWVFWHKFWSSKTGEEKEGPYQDRKKIMKTLCRKAGVRYFRFHALRHFGASMLADHGESIVVIQRLLGHENIKTTEFYLHSIGESEREAMEVLDSLDVEPTRELRSGEKRLRSKSPRKFPRNLDRINSDEG